MNTYIVGDLLQSRVGDGLKRVNEEQVNAPSFADDLLVWQMRRPYLRSCLALVVFEVV